MKSNWLALSSVQKEMLNNTLPGVDAQVSAKEMVSYICSFVIQYQIYINGKGYSCFQTLCIAKLIYLVMRVIGC